MQTRCPDCQTTFNITQQHLNMANGRVRCNQCQCVFDGYVHLIDEDAPAPPVISDLASNSAATQEPEAPSIDFNKEKGNRVDITPGDTPKPNTLIYSDLLEDDYDKPQPLRVVGNIALGLLCLCATLALLAQVVYLNRAELAEHPGLAPIIHDSCNQLSFCDIPEKRALEKLSLDSRHVYSHPNVTKALVVSATFSNQAVFPQIYPTLVLSMSNIRGQEVAARHFSPADYLPAFDERNSRMQPGESVSISLEVADPGNEAMAFELDFL